MDKIIKELKGHSGSTVILMENSKHKFVRKIDNVSRNYERLIALNARLPVPKIYSYKDDVLDMEYIHGLDMRNYLLHNDPSDLVDFLTDTLYNLSYDCTMKDYTDVYHSFLDFVDGDECLPFRRNELIEKLPKVLPSSNYHGDMTLENIIKSSKGFYFIDPVTVKFDSYIFDIVKLRQDLECKWFLRKDPLPIDSKLAMIRKKILDRFEDANDNYLLILMLLRVYLHCSKGDFEHKFILNEVNRLWKS